jgi:hypothetical protein
LEELVVGGLSREESEKERVVPAGTAELNSPLKK